MKYFLRSIYVLSLAILVSCNQNNQSKKAEDTVVVKQRPEDSADEVLHIKNEVERINTLKSEVKSHTFQCDEKVLATYYFENGKPVRIILDWGVVGDYYRREEYYYQNEKLIYAYDFLQGGPACEGCETLTEKRNYIKDDQVVRYMVGEEVKNCENCNYPQAHQAYQIYALTSADELRKMLCK